MAEKKTSEPILTEALERFKESQDGTDFSRIAYEQDVRFSRLGEQWPENIAKVRKDEDRPCLTINKLPALVRHVVNEARQNKPGISVTPVDNGADKNTAEVLSGIVRSIERNSIAGIAYDTAIDHAVSGGFGFFEIGIDYCHEDSFDMECRIHRVPNPLMVHWDPNSTAFDASDWDFAFISDMLSEVQFKARYPGAAEVSFEGDKRDSVSHWLEDDKIRVARYWLRTEKTRKILLLSDGNTVRADLYDKPMQGAAIPGMTQRAFNDVKGVQVKKERQATYYEVMRRTISGVEVLDEEPWPGTMIPICPVWGEEVILDGRRHFRSMIRDAKDPQKMFNFWRSASTELVALAPRAPWLLEEGAIPRGQEAKWQSANTRSHAYLSYTKGSQVPQRQPFASVPAGALQEATNSNEDMQSTTGIYPSSIGERAPETSGKAILARERQGNVSNFHFIDNLGRAIGYAGKIFMEIIPHTYTGRETIRILGEDMKEKVAKLISENPPGMEGPPKATIPGQTPDDEPMYNLSVGKYDVEVKQGPSYGTQREETRETLTEIMTQVPGAAVILGDVLMEHMDFQGADKIAERLKLLLPPQIQAAEGIQVPQMPMQPGMPPAGMPSGPMAGPGLAPQVPGAPHAPPAMPAPPQGVPGL